ncbi:unnamed protein product [Blepharisma stoltei]|uniref:Phosphodiesterase n=1 Tax=Blepharisma stoltei TaxID=1481888 RepID=A0AAU9KBB7_9CILI|nr:unnamed protein product [Blepharisma stoltei]
MFIILLKYFVAMNCKSINYEKSDPPIQYQIKPSIYSILDHEEQENIFVPLNTEILTYHDKEMNFKYNQTLFCSKTAKNAPSNELKGTLTYFYIFLIGYFIITITTLCLLYNEGEQTYDHLIFRLIFLIFMACISILILYFLWKSTWVLHHNQMIFFIFGLLCITFFIISDERVLSQITGNDYSKNHQSQMMILVCFMIFLKDLFFDTFRYFSLLSLFCVVLLLSLFLTVSSLSIFTNLSEMLVIFIFLSIKSIETYQTEYRAKILFWRKLKEEEKLDTVSALIDSTKSGQAYVNTEIELMYSSCDKVLEQIKSAKSVIMFKDVKNTLKSAINEVEKLKRQIAHNTFLKDPKFAKNVEFDQEDKDYLKQQFMITADPSNIGSSFLKVNLVKQQVKLESFPGHQLLSGLGVNWNFDVWFLFQVTNESLSTICKYFFQLWGLAETFSILEETEIRFFKTLETNYFQNPYHNACHAADVLHSLFYFYMQSDIIKNITPLDTMASIIAAAGHDVGHPALSNRFLINNKHELSLSYNDDSVLENMHIAKIFRIMSNEDCNIFGGLKTEDWFKARKLIIKMILDTDMSKHFECFGRFKMRAQCLCDLSFDNFDDKVIILCMALKCADIGHSAKNIELHEKWTNLICEEFYRQGDLEKERGQQVSAYCDRSNSDIAKNQSGFLRFICVPSFDIWCGFLDNEEINKNVLVQVHSNLTYWEDKIRTRKFSLELVSDLNASSTKDFMQLYRKQSLMDSKLMSRMLR